jgi:hypothetical protein
VNTKHVQTCVRNIFLHENVDARRCFALLVRMFVFCMVGCPTEAPVAYFVPLRNESNISGILDKMIHDEKCALLDHYAAGSGNSLPTFREIYPIFKGQESK